MTVYHDLREAVTDEKLAALASELTALVGKESAERVFSDDWTSSGQRAWVNLAGVAAFTLRPAR